jgi:hypothetical protein
MRFEELFFYKDTQRVNKDMKNMKKMLNIFSDYGNPNQSHMRWHFTLTSMSMIKTILAEKIATKKLWLNKSINEIYLVLVRMWRC